MLPYGANIILKSTQSTINTDLYPLGYSFFMTSQDAIYNNKVTTIKYTYSNTNGEVIGVSTNLDSILNTVNHTLTLSTTTKLINGKTNLYGTSDGKKPYIKLLCNNVKVECYIDNSSGNNGFRQISQYNDNVELIARSDQNESITVPRYLTVNWDSTTRSTFTPVISYNLSSQFKFMIFLNYGYLDNNNNFVIEDNQIIGVYTENGALNELKSLSRSLPNLNGKESFSFWDYGNNNREHAEWRNKYCNYFKIGYSFWLYGEPFWAAGSVSYITGKNIIYDELGFYNENNLGSSRYYLHGSGVPIRFGEQVDENNNFIKKWNCFAYKTIDFIDGKMRYISPSSSEIRTDWNNIFTLEQNNISSNLGNNTINSYLSRNIIRNGTYGEYILVYPFECLNYHKDFGFYMEPSIWHGGSDDSEYGETILYLINDDGSYKQLYAVNTTQDIDGVSFQINGYVSAPFAILDTNDETLELELINPYQGEEEIKSFTFYLLQDLDTGTYYWYRQGVGQNTTQTDSEINNQTNTKTGEVDTAEGKGVNVRDINGNYLGGLYEGTKVTIVGEATITVDNTPTPYYKIIYQNSYGYVIQSGITLD